VPYNRACNEADRLQDAQHEEMQTETSMNMQHYPMAQHIELWPPSRLMGITRSPRMPRA
jgi:hypothetical protein